MEPPALVVLFRRPPTFPCTRSSVERSWFEARGRGISVKGLDVMIVMISRGRHGAAELRERKEAMALVIDAIERPQHLQGAVFEVGGQVGG